MLMPKRILWCLRVAVSVGVGCTAAGAAFIWMQAQPEGDATLIHPYLIGVAGYIGAILAVFIGILALPLARLSREFPGRVFWRTILHPLPVICLGGLIAEGAICFSGALSPSTIHPSAPLWCFVGATLFLVALFGYVLLISKPSHAVGMYKKFARHVLRKETSSLLRQRYIAFVTLTAPDRLIAAPIPLLRALFRRLPTLLADWRKRGVSWTVLASAVQSVGTGCVLALRDTFARHRRHPGPLLVCELQWTAHGLQLVTVDPPQTQSSFSVCGERTRLLIEDIGSIGRQGIHDSDLDLVRASYGLLDELNAVAMDVHGHYELEDDELVSVFRQQFSLAVLEAVACSDNRVLPAIVNSASSLANGIVDRASTPIHSHVILSAAGFRTVFRAVTSSRAVQEDESVACWTAIEALVDLGVKLIQKQYRMSAHSIINDLKDTAGSYIRLTKAGPHRPYPDTLAGRALSGILRMWAADIPNWTIWSDSSLSSKAATDVKELAELYITQRADSIDAEALGELTHFGNVRYLRPTGSFFHPSSALSDALMDQTQNAEVLLGRLGYATQDPSRFLIDLLQSATTNRKPFVAGQLASEVADIVLLYLALLRQLERAVKAEGSEWPVSRLLQDAMKGVSRFSAFAAWRLADALVAFLDCSSVGLTDFADQLLRVVWACVFISGCEPDFDLRAAVDNVGSIVGAKGQEIIRTSHGAPVVRLLAFWYTRKLKPASKHASTLLGLAKASLPSGTDPIGDEDFYPTRMGGGMWIPRRPMCASPPHELADGIAALLDPQELQDFRTEVFKGHQP